MRVLAVGAHPDDIEIGCGGSIAKHIEKGDTVDFLVMTNGEAGSMELSKADLYKKRQLEALAGAKILGVENVHFFGLEDGLTFFTRDQKISMIKKIRELRPDILYLHSSSDDSFDHQVVHKLVLAATFSASGPWFGEAGDEAPHEVKAIYGFEVWSPLSRFQKINEIDEDQMGLKVKALACHKSQTEDYNYIDAVKGLASYRGAMTGRSKYAEVFEVIKSLD